MLKLSVADKRWAGRRCIVAASGPSLTTEVVRICDGEHIIAVNDAYKLIPHADVLYACDVAWWKVNEFVSNFAGERWTSHSLSPRNDKTNMPHNEDFHIIAGSAAPGFSTNTNILHYGNNSGFQAVNLAILFGAKEVVLIGFDMRTVNNQSHFFGNYKTPLRDTHSFITWINAFRTAAKNLDKIGVRIINATHGSALNCFPIMTLEEALNPVLEAAE